MYVAPSETYLSFFFRFSRYDRSNRPVFVWTFYIVQISFTLLTGYHSKESATRKLFKSWNSAVVVATTTKTTNLLNSWYFATKVRPRTWRGTTISQTTQQDPTATPLPLPVRIRLNQAALKKHKNDWNNVKHRTLYQELSPMNWRVTWCVPPYTEELPRILAWIPFQHFHLACLPACLKTRN